MPPTIPLFEKSVNAASGILSHPAYPAVSYFNLESGRIPGSAGDRAIRSNKNARAFLFRFYPLRVGNDGKLSVCRYPTARHCPPVFQPEFCLAKLRKCVHIKEKPVVILNFRDIAPRIIQLFLTHKMVLNGHSGTEEDHEPREQSLSRSGFHDFTRKTRLVSHEPREPSLWCPLFYPDSHLLRMKTEK
jgi:hypothetical protein